MTEVIGVPPEMFRFSIGDRADLYTAILEIFGAANERLETTLGLDDIAARLLSLGRFGGRFRFLVRDRDTKYTAGFDAAFNAARGTSTRRGG